MKTKQQSEAKHKQMIAARVDRDFKARIEALALKERRSVSDIIVFALERYLANETR